MKIRFVGRMAKRPVREPIARLDDRREPDTEGSTRVDGRQAIEPDKSVKLKPTASRAHGNVRARHFVRERTAVAIAAEGVDGPLPRWGEVELVVRRLPFHRDEGFEAGVLPELCSDAWHAGQRDPDPGTISVEAEGHPEFSACRSAYEHLNGAHRLRACRRMAPEVNPVFDGHNGLGGCSGIALRPEYRVKLWAPKPSSAPRFYCPAYRHRDIVREGHRRIMAQREIRRNGSKSALAPILGCPSNHVKAAGTRQFRSFLQRIPRLRDWLADGAVRCGITVTPRHLFGDHEVVEKPIEKDDRIRAAHRDRARRALPAVLRDVDRCIGKSETELKLAGPHTMSH
jgi:hypothetical protein